MKTSALFLSLLLLAACGEQTGKTQPAGEPMTLPLSPDFQGIHGTPQGALAKGVILGRYSAAPLMLAIRQEKARRSGPKLLNYN